MPSGRAYLCLKFYFRCFNQVQIWCLQSKRFAHFTVYLVRLADKYLTIFFNLATKGVIFTDQLISGFDNSQVEGKGEIEVGDDSINV